MGRKKRKNITFIEGTIRFPRTPSLLGKYWLIYFYFFCETPTAARRTHNFGFLFYILTG